MPPILAPKVRAAVRRTLLCTLLATVLPGCSQTGTTSDPPPMGPPAPGDPPPPPPSFSGARIAAGNNQLGLSGKTLLEPLVIQVLKDGSPQAGVRVFWTASSGAVTSPSQITDELGRAEATWQLGPAGGLVTLSAAAVGTSTDTVTFSAVAVQSPSSVIERSTQGQTGTVGSLLQNPLRITVRYGSAPLAGVEVRWSTTNGIVEPATSFTGADGVATAGWTLGYRAGEMEATALVERYGGWTSLSFRAYAQPGRPAEIYQPFGTPPGAPANWPYFGWLAAGVTDLYENPIANVPLEWSVTTGGAVIDLRSGGMTGPSGVGQVWLAPGGVEGPVVVQARVAGTDIATHFDLEAGPPQLHIRLNLRGSVPVFVSGQNGSSPAVDTIPAGSLMTWIMDGYDYDYHRIAPFNGSAMPDPGAFPQYEDQVQAVFTVPPGTYTYWDSESGAAGTVVVQ